MLGDLSIHTRKHTVLVPIEDFFSKSKALKKISIKKRDSWILSAITCYMDGVVRLTYGYGNSRMANEYYYPGIEAEFDKDIERILDI